MSDDIQALQTIMALRCMTVGGAVIINQADSYYFGWVGLIHHFHDDGEMVTVWTTSKSTSSIETIKELTLPIDCILPPTEKSMNLTGNRGVWSVYDDLFAAFTKGHPRYVIQSDHSYHP